MVRYYYNAKTEADSLKKIQVWYLRRNGFLEKNTFKSGSLEWTSGWDGSKSSIWVVGDMIDGSYVELSYTQTNQDGEKQDFKYRIQVVTTPCHFGGERHWFICPCSRDGKYCGRRVAILYKSGDYFACRHCYQLTYQSRNQAWSPGLSPLFGSLWAFKKIDDLEQKMKRRFYAGKPTKLQQKVFNEQRKIMRWAPLIDRDRGVK